MSGDCGFQCRCFQFADKPADSHVAKNRDLGRPAKARSIFPEREFPRTPGNQQIAEVRTKSDSGLFLMRLWRALRRYSQIPYFIREVGHPRHLGSLLATSWPCSEVHN